MKQKSTTNLGLIMLYFSLVVGKTSRRTSQLELGTWPKTGSVARTQLLIREYW